MVDKADTISKASKGYIEDYYNSNQNVTVKGSTVAFGDMPKFDREEALDLIRKDPVVLSALNTLVDRSLEKGYRLEGVDGKSREKEANKLRDDLRLNKILRQVFFNLYAYGNVFVENIKNGNGLVKELHVLETTHTEPVVDEHGEVQYYQQQVNAKQKNMPTWKPDEVTHIAITKLTTKVWGELDVESIYTTVLVKQYIMSYLGWLFGTNQFKGFYNIKNASDVQVKEFLTFLRTAEKDISKPVIASGEIVYQMLRDFDDGTTIIELLSKLDSNILTLMQVPPISVGLPDNSNRSNSDAQDSSLLTRIRAVQDVVEDEFAFDLFPKIGFEKVRLIFNPLKQANISKLLEDAERMNTIGFKPEVIEEYLKSEGFPIKKALLLSDEEKLKKQQVLSPIQNVSGQKKSEDMFPSRKRKSEGQANEKIGTGENSTTRSDQLAKGKSFNSYPYVYKIEE